MLFAQRRPQSVRYAMEGRRDTARPYGIHHHLWVTATAVMVIILAALLFEAVIRLGG
jgi:hypothetical protein